MTIRQLSITAATIFGRANETLTAGDFVRPVSGDTDVVGSGGVSTFVWDDLDFERCDSGNDYPYCVGIVAEAASEEDLVTVFTEGLFIVRSGEAITPGSAIQKAESTDYAEVEGLDSTYAEHRIGRAISGTSDADKYLIIKLDA